MLVAIFLLLLVPVLFGVNGLDATASAAPLEMLVSLVGVLLITPAFAPEQNDDIREVVESKCLYHEKVCIIRIVISGILTAILTSTFVLIMRLNGCDVGLSHAFGTLSNGLFLGGIGLMAFGLSGNITVGYMIPMIYYALNLTGAGKAFGALYLFSMTYGGHDEKLWLFAFGIISIILTFMLRNITRKRK